MSGQPIEGFSPAVSDEEVEGRPWWKVCCLGCCLGIVVLAVLIVVGVRLIAGPGPRTVEALPTSYPKELVFVPETAAEIMYYPAASKSTATKIITVPLEWIGSIAGSNGTSTVGNVGDLIGAQLRRVEGRDTVSIRWKDLNRSRDEVLRFYAGSLRGLGIYSPQTTNPNGTWDVRMVGRNDRISFDLQMQDDPDKPGIDSLNVVTEYAVEK